MRVSPTRTKARRSNLETETLTTKKRGTSPAAAERTEMEKGREKLGSEKLLGRLALVSLIRRFSSLQVDRKVPQNDLSQHSLP